MLFLNIGDVAIITVKNVDYCCIMYHISKSEAINLLVNYVLQDCACIKKHCLNFQSFQGTFFTFLV